MESLKPKTHLLRGDSRKKIPSLAHKLGVDLVVMGTIGRAGIPGLLMGNTAEAILDQAECSVLAIKPPGFITPVVRDD
jgi:nucleotide-binding universal stress UspA family protein